MRNASAISRNFPHPLRRCGTTVRASCWVSVDAPDTMRRCHIACPIARTIAKGSTPGCQKKRLSSAAIMALCCALTELIELHVARSTTIVGADFSQKRPVPIEHTDRGRVATRIAELGGQRGERGRPEEHDPRRQEKEGDPGGFLHGAFTSTVIAPERPKTSGTYISSALVGGTTNVPNVVARARYR